MTLNSVNWRLVVPGIFVLVALFYCYWDVLTILVTQWSTNDAYSHGFLMPAISAGIVWRSRHRLARLPLAGSPIAGTVVLAAALGVLLFGRAIDIIGIQQLSLLPSLAGVALLLGGGEALRLLWFPISYLAFMMPVWDVVTERLHYPFQQFSAHVGGYLLQAVGIPVLQLGTYLQLPNVTLEVARVCSGVNYLVAVAAVGVPLAYLTFPDWLRRCLLVAFGLVIAIVANPVRVALIGVFSHFGLSTDLHGPGHVFQGLFVAGVGYVALLCGVAVLRRWGRRSTFQHASPALTEASGPPRSEGRAGRPTRLRHEYGLGAGLATLLLLLASAFTTPALAAKSDSAEWSTALPSSIGAWRQIYLAGYSDRASNRPRLYHNALGQRVELRFGPVIPSYDTGGPTWPERIMLQATPVSLDVSEDDVVTINRAHDTNGGRRIPVLYWYDLNGRVSRDRTTAKIHIIWYRFTSRGRPPVTVFVKAAGDGSSDEALGTAMAFTRELVAVLRTPLDPHPAGVPAGTPTGTKASRAQP